VSKSKFHSIGTCSIAPAMVGCASTVAFGLRAQFTHQPTLPPASALKSAASFRS